MSLEPNSGSPRSFRLLLRDLPKLIWALVLLIGGVAYTGERLPLGLGAGHQPAPCNIVLAVPMSSARFDDHRTG